MAGIVAWFRFGAVCVTVRAAVCWTVCVTVCVTAAPADGVARAQDKPEIVEATSVEVVVGDAPDPAAQAERGPAPPDAEGRVPYPNNPGATSVDFRIRIPASWGTIEWDGHGMQTYEFLGRPVRPERPAAFFGGIAGPDGNAVCCTFCWSSDGAPFLEAPLFAPRQVLDLHAQIAAGSNYRLGGGDLVSSSATFERLHDRTAVRTKAVFRNGPKVADGAIIEWAVPARYRYGDGAPCTWTFQFAGRADAVAANEADFDEAIRSIRFPLPPPAPGPPSWVPWVLGVVVVLVLLGWGVAVILRRRRGPRPPLGPSPLYVLAAPDVCGACGATLAAEFCAKCSQRRVRGRLDVRDVVRDWIEKVADVERGLLGTTVGLTRRPGEVIREYVAGRRAPYATPVRYFISWLVVSALTVGFVRDRLPEEQQSLVLVIARDLRPYAQQVQSWERWFLGLFMVVVLAWAGARLFRRSSLTFGEHLAAALFAVGHSLLVVAVFALAAWAFDATPLVMVGAFCSLASVAAILAAFHRRVYGTWGAAWRAVVAIAMLEGLMIWFALVLGLVVWAAKGIH